MIQVYKTEMSDKLKVKVKNTAHSSTKLKKLCEDEAKITKF